MSHSLHVLPEVEEDALNAYRWYEEKAKGLGEEFLRVFYANALEIPRNPFLCRLVYKDFRRRLLRRFPYAIYYRVNEQQVIITGLYHCARNPIKLEEELRIRKDK